MRTRSELALALFAFVTLGLGAAFTFPRTAPMSDESETRPSLFRVILPVSSLDEAASFYEKVLGFEGMRISPGRHYFTCGETILACFDPNADGDGYEPTPNPEWLYFAVDDLEAVHGRCAKAGAKFEEASADGSSSGDIVTRPWGERSFYVRDPFGNKICFVDRKTKFTGR